MSQAYYADRLGPKSKRSISPEGYMIAVGIPIARTGSQTYRAAEISAPGLPGEEFVEVIRLPEEVFAPETIASFEGKSITSPHPPIFLSPENDSAYHKGHAQNVRQGEELENGERALIADLIFKDASLISNIDAGGMDEISCGYNCEYSPIPGQTHKFYQRKIRGNHIAIVPTGRAGDAVRVLDILPEGVPVPDSQFKEDLVPDTTKVNGGEPGRLSTFFTDVKDFFSLFNLTVVPSTAVRTLDAAPDKDDEKKAKDAAEEEKKKEAAKDAESEAVTKNKEKNEEANRRQSAMQKDDDRKTRDDDKTKDDDRRVKDDDARRAKDASEEEEKEKKTKDDDDDRRAKDARHAKDDDDDRRTKDARRAHDDDDDDDKKKTKDASDPEGESMKKKATDADGEGLNKTLKTLVELLAKQMGVVLVDSSDKAIDSELIPVETLKGDEIPQNPIPGADKAVDEALAELKRMKPIVAATRNQQAIDSWNAAYSKLRMRQLGKSDSGSDAFRLMATDQKKPDAVKNAEAGAVRTRDAAADGADFANKARKFHRRNLSEVTIQ